MRSMWSGTVTFGMVSIPVKMYKATDSNGTGLNLLCKCHMQQITKRDRCQVDDHILESHEKVRASHTDAGWILLDDADLAGLPLKTMHTIEIEAFVPQSQVPLATHANGVYYLEPNDPAKMGSAKPYALLRGALAKSGTYAIGRIGMHDKEQLCSLSVQNNILVVTTLTWPALVRDATPLHLPLEKPSDAELALASQLLDAMRDDWDGESYRDAYKPALNALIEARAKGKPAPVSATPAKTVPDLLTDLRASIAKQGRKRPARKAS